MAGAAQITNSKTFQSDIAPAINSLKTKKPSPKNEEGFSNFNF
jgi:hypothetical protein